MITNLIMILYYQTREALLLPLNIHQRSIHQLEEEERMNTIQKTYQMISTISQNDDYYNNNNN